MRAAQRVGQACPMSSALIEATRRETARVCEERAERFPDFTEWNGTVLTFLVRSLAPSAPTMCDV